MSSLRTKVEKQLQLCLELLGPNVNENEDLPMKVEIIEEGMSSLKLFFKKQVSRKNQTM